MPAATLLFRVERGRATMLTEFVDFSAEDMEHAAGAVFQRFPDVGVVSMPAVQRRHALERFPARCYTDRADIVIALPDTTEAYTASLSQSTRSTVRNRLNRLRREHPSMTVRAEDGWSADPDLISRLVAMSNARLSDTGRHSYNDAGMVHNFHRLAATSRSLLLTIWIDGQLCGGSWNVRAGSGYFGFINTFDQRYSRYSLGMLSAYLSVCEAIRQGARRFHTGWQRYDYKYQLGGAEQPSWRYEIYRSQLHCVRRAPQIVLDVAEDRMRQLKTWMQAPERRNRFLTRAATASVNRVRALAGRHTDRAAAKDR